MAAAIFNIPASCRFSDVLANKILQDCNGDYLSLTDVTILLPNHRACREMRNAFVRLHGMEPTLLPRLLPLGEAEEEEIFFSEIGEQIQNLPPAISPIERILLFTRLITARNSEFDIENISFAQAAMLAQDLANLVDMVIRQELSFDKLHDLVPEEYASHWQKTLNFLQIVTKFLPQILQERGQIDAAERSCRMLQIQQKFWQQHPPRHKVIIAGTTAVFPAMKELVKTVLALPQGEVYLSGLDKYLDDDSWEQINESHPQFELKQLLDYLQISRFDISDAVPSINPEREKFISEAMRPAATTDKWRNLSEGDIIPQAFDRLRLINCREIFEEAAAIALIMRQTLETPGKTAALVTTDRNLARRVASQLQRWNIAVDDSAGKPLALTPIGVFLRLIAEYCQEPNFDPLKFIALLKHPLSSFGKNRQELLKEIRQYEKQYLRQRQVPADIKQPVAAYLKILAPLQQLLHNPQASFADILRLHVAIAEKIASDCNQSGDKILWRGDDGEIAARLISELLQYADTIGNISCNQYDDFFSALLGGVSVRPKYGTHPRLKILGPIESRLTGFDTVIIGEVNEGSFPAKTDNGAFMSRPMKKDFGLPLPEQNVGVLAHDFCNMLAQSEVYITRSERVEGTPTVKSRWLMRCEAVLQAAGFEATVIQDQNFANWAAWLDKTEQRQPIGSPHPRPPVYARPRELWATAVENLMRDPYIIFAKHILRLKPMEAINRTPDVLDFGDMVHKILEQFNCLYPSELPENAKDILFNMLQEEISRRNLDSKTLAFWQPAAQKMLLWLLQEETKYRGDITKVNCEVSGSINFDAPAGTFTIAARADRIDIRKDGEVNIIDYKTGSARKIKEIKNGYAPQLPIEGIIATKGGFENISAASVHELAYWRLGKEKIAISTDMEELLKNYLTHIKQIIALFDQADQPYLTQPNPEYAPTYSDYEHLSRIKEWGITDDNDESI